MPFAIYDSNSDSYARTQIEEKKAAGSDFSFGFDEQSARKSELGVLDARTQELMRLFLNKLGTQINADDKDQHG